MVSNQSRNALFNAANIIKGGALQAAVNFILASQNSADTALIWYFVISDELNNELQKVGILLTKNSLIIKGSSTHNSLIRKEILTFEQANNINIVFTLYGPCYIKFKSIHISGFANGWITHATLSTFIDTYKGSILKIIKSILKYCYYAFYIRKANGWIFETSTAKLGFIRRFKVPKKQCFVVPNTSISFGKSFNKIKETHINGIKLKFTDNLFVALSADYPHKNLISLLNAANILKYSMGEIHFKIIFTLPAQTFVEDFIPYIIKNNLEQQCLNIGKIDIADLSKIYGVAYASILPSFIETFSAVYPESFATGTPVITSRKAFATEICKNAALYIDPNNPIEIADAMKLLINEPNKYNELKSNGDMIFSSMLTPDEKYQKYMKVLANFS
ncbi:MAG: glycosyltransferase [Colwellia sp.]|nr:glycosyltransferase [Colwellia sp.]